MASSHRPASFRCRGRGSAPGGDTIRWAAGGPPGFEHGRRASEVQLRAYSTTDQGKSPALREKRCTQFLQEVHKSQVYAIAMGSGAIRDEGARPEWREGLLRRWRKHASQ